MIYLSGKVHPDYGTMLTPAMGNRHPSPFHPWAADTGCFAAPDDFSFARYLVFLNRLAWDHGDRCLFATAPDRFNDWEATRRHTLPTLAYIRDMGYPAALVIQPHAHDLPWDDLDALFVGGPNAWQHSNQVLRLVAEAKRRDKWVHVGRVNGWTRYRWATEIDADSVDGTFLAFGPDKNLPKLQAWEARAAAQPSLQLEFI